MCGKSFESYKVCVLYRNRYSEKEVPPVCYDCRKPVSDKMSQEFQEMLLRDRMERIESWRKSSGIPMRYQAERFNTFEVTEQNKLAYDTCLEYANKFPVYNALKCPSLGIISAGKWGVGKTHLVCSIAHAVIEKCISVSRNPVCYMTESQMFTRVRATFEHRPDTETEQEFYALVSKVPLLIIDDVGKEEVADPRFVQRVWFQVVNSRYDNMLPVLITANMSPDKIANHLGGSRNNEAVFDRLYEMLKGVFYEITGESYRRKQP